jgi:hypothetical protein
VIFAADPCMCSGYQTDPLTGNCTFCGGWSMPRTAPEPASGGCGECAIVRNCRETGYCPCLRVPFVAAADARRAIERRQP